MKSKYEALIIICNIYNVSLFDEMPTIKIIGLFYSTFRIENEGLISFGF